MTFGMIYWLLPRLFQTQLYSKKLAEMHFWVATFGILLYVVAIYSAGVTQGLMWRAFDETGRLAYPDFIETVCKLMPMYWMRAVGGSLYIVGMLLFGYNILHDVASAGRRRTTCRSIQAPRPRAETSPSRRTARRCRRARWARFVAHAMAPRVGAAAG